MCKLGFTYRFTVLVFVIQSMVTLFKKLVSKIICFAFDLKGELKLRVKRQLCVLIFLSVGLSVGLSACITL